ncbi:hypothetical protein J6590_027972 [Homalodisca vitripennis]|nr:hypothetical protein J6590_027972 [Homalodisca vitripennis]
MAQCRELRTKTSWPSALCYLQSSHEPATAFNGSNGEREKDSTSGIPRTYINESCAAYVNSGTESGTKTGHEGRNHNGDVTKTTVTVTVGYLVMRNKALLMT